MSEQYAETRAPVEAFLLSGKPLPEIDFPWPDCPICDAELEHDDGWSCPSCEVYWRRDGSNPQHDPAQSDGEETPDARA